MIRRGTRAQPLTALAFVLALAACQATPSLPPTPEASPTTGPTPTAAIGEVDHETGATDLVFQFAEGGGFVAADFFPTYAPIVSIYGDGTVIFRDVDATPPEHDDNIGRLAPFQIARLTEAQLQEFLRFAIADGGLAVARESYSGPGADLPTATFTLNAGGLSKTVSVMALGMDRTGDPDEQILLALARLGEKVWRFSNEMEDEVPWAPDRWRGVLQEGVAEGALPWPWPEIAPADFIENDDPDAPRFPSRTMTPEEVALLGLEDIDGGVSGISLLGPDGKTYSFALRPLLPNEER